MPFKVSKALVKLRDSPDPDATNRAGVLVMSDVLEKVGPAGAPGWSKVRVVTPGVAPREGFVRDDLLVETQTPQVVAEEIDKESFFDQLTLSSRVFGGNNYYLYALAFLESGVKNIKSKTSNAFGPFQFMPATWSELVLRFGSSTGVTDMDLRSPGRQAIMAAVWMADLQRRLVSALGRVPSGSELYFGHLLGPTAAAHVLRGERSELIDRPLRRFFKGTSRGEQFVDVILKSNASLLRSAPGQVRSVSEVLKEVASRFEPGLAEAEELAVKLGLSPEKLPGDPGEHPPWMAVAQAELAAGIVEDKVASNPEVEKYFEATSLGRASDDTAWCAAFVSWCMAHCGDERVAARNRRSARASDWLDWGFSTGRPVHGGVVVMHPLVEGSSGHVGFLTEANGRIRLLAGNQRNEEGKEAVCEVDFKPSEVRDFRWLDWKTPTGD